MKSSLLLFLLLPLCTFAQVSFTGTIRDESTEAPLAFARIYNSTQQKGVYTNAKGQFSIAVASTDTLRIDDMGYEMDQLFGDSLQKALADTNFILALKPRFFELETFEVKGRNTPTYASIGLHQPKRKTTLGSQIAGIEYCTLIQNPAYAGQLLEEVLLAFKRKSTGKLRLHLYRVQSDGTPGEELLTKNVVFETANFKGKIGHIALDQQPLYLPESGVFVGIEWIKAFDATYENPPHIYVTQGGSEYPTYWKLNLKQDHWTLCDRKHFPNMTAPSLCVGLRVRD